MPNSLFEKLGRWLWRLLLIYLGLLVLESAAAVTAIVALSGPADADLTAMQLRATTSSLLTMVYSGYAQAAVYIVIAILFLRLLYKAVQRAKGFAVPFTYVSPAWAVGYWFIPLMNLYRTFQVVKALFTACAQEAGPTAKPAAGEQLLGAWWALFLIGNAANWALASSTLDLNSRAGLTSYAEYSIGCNLLVIAATLLFSLVVKRLVLAMGSTGHAATLPGDPMNKHTLVFGLMAWAVSTTIFAAPTPAPVNLTLLKQQRADALAQNDLITQVQAAQVAKDWPKAEALLQQLIAKDPQDWQYCQGLADVQLQEGKYAAAADSYTAALLAAGKVKLTPTLREAMAMMYTNEGNAFIKLKRNDDAIKAYTQAAQLSSHPDTAWFNLCATQYNLGNMDGALTACDKAIAADPTKADAYFIKGGILVGNSTTDAAGKTVAPPGAVEALQKYLALAPDGPHVADVKAMLDYLNGKTP